MTRIIIILSADLSLVKRESESFLKLNLFPKWFANDLSNKMLAKRFCFIKSWSLLVSKVSLWKGFGKTKFVLWKLYLSKREMIPKQNNYQNPLILTHFWKWLVLPNKGFPKDSSFQNLPQRTNPNLRYNLMVNLLLFTRMRGKVTVSVGSQLTQLVEQLRNVHWDSEFK